MTEYNIDKPFEKTALSFRNILVALAFIGVCRSGPIDFTRSVYHAMSGDTPALHSALEKTCERGIRHVLYGINKNYLPSDVEARLRNELQVSFDYERNVARTEEASIEDLWDCAEQFAESKIERYLWTMLDQ